MGGVPVLKYELKPQSDGRIIIEYSLVDKSQEFLMQIINLQMYYKYFGTPTSSSNGECFAEKDEVFYTRDNLGRTYYNYPIDGKTNELGLREITKLTASTESIKISSKTAFDFAILKAPDKWTYTPIDTEGAGDATNLLGYSLLTNKSSAEGNVKVNYKFDTENSWNYGVTTVQYWTVDAAYTDPLTKADATQYTYNFDFTLAKKDTGETLEGNYALTPADEYKNVKISRDPGKEKNLLSYDNLKGRYYYYVNREMLAQGLREDQKQGIDLNNYYIKELSYILYISATGSSNYVSGLSGRPKESGGQYYGYTFNDQTANANFNITDINDGSNKLTANVKTAAKKHISSTSTPEVSLFLQDNMTVKNEASQLLSMASQEVSVGERITVEATGLSNFYPYGFSNYSPDPVFIIRTPKSFDLDSGTIQLNQAGGKLKHNLDYLGVLSDDSQLFYVTVTSGSGLGYFNEEREWLGKPITISYQMQVNNLVQVEAIKYQELLFITDQNYQNGTTSAGSFASYRNEDTFGVNKRLVEKNKTPFWQYKENAASYLLTTNRQYQFSINATKLDTDLATELESEQNSDFVDPNNPEHGAVLDKEDAAFDLTFSMSNTKQNGYVSERGKFIFYLPVAKVGVIPEWNPEQVNDFSLALTGPVKITSKLGVAYEIGYTTDKIAKFNNRMDNFLPSDENNTAGFAEYFSFEEIQAAGKLSEVTMVKVIARKANGNQHIIPFGEEMKAVVPLAYDKNNPQEFYQYAGEKTSWRPFLIQWYSINEVFNQFNSYGSEKTMRIRYRPPEQIRDIWAYNEDDYPGGNNGAIQMNRITSVDLPQFNQEFKLQLSQLTDRNLINMTLDEITAFKDLEKPVSYGNTTFGFTTDLVGKAPPTNLAEGLDMYSAYNGGPSQLMGKTSSKTINTLRYQVFNAANINDPSGVKQIRINYSSMNEMGEATDDLNFTIVLNIKRKISIIDAKTSLIAGKEYYAFPDIAENVKTTLTDGAFTVQYTYPADMVPKFPAEDTEVYLEFGDIATTSGLPPKATILMKVQSFYEEADEIKRIRPEYYFYKNNTNAIQSKVQLTDFIKMGTNDVKLSLAQINSHVEAMENQTEGQLSYLFIVDFGEGHTEEISSNKINLKYRIKETYSIEEEDKIPRYGIEAQRTIKNELNAAENNTYTPHEKIAVKGKFDLSDSGTAIDAYNAEKNLSLNLKLYKDQKQIKWPQGTLIESDSLNEPLVPRIIDELEFIYPVNRISSGLSIPYEFMIATNLEELSAGNYRIEISSWKDHTTKYPLAGDMIDTDIFLFTVKANEKIGLRVSSDLSKQFIYNQTNKQQAKITLAQDNLARIEVVLQKKNISGSYERVLTPHTLIKTDLTSPLTGSIFNLQFNDQIDANHNGEYRLLFSGYKSENVTSQPDVETDWTFIVWDPLE